MQIWNSYYRCFIKYYCDFYTPLWHLWGMGRYKPPKPLQEDLIAGREGY